MAHHDRVGLSHEVGFHTAGQYDGGNQGAGGRSKVFAQFVRQIRVGADEFGAVSNEPDGAFDLFIAVGTALSHHHVIRVDIVHGKTGFVQCVDQPRLADDVGAAVWMLGCQEAGRGQCAGIEVGRLHLDAEAVEFFLELARGLLAAVGQKQKFLAFFLEPLHKSLRPGQQSVPVVDDPVHVADKPPLFPQKIQIHGWCPFGSANDRSGCRTRIDNTRFVPCS